jgi:hypothetical protein
MTLSERLLEKLASGPPPGATATTFAHADDEAQASVRLDIARLDALSGQYDAIHVHRSAPAALGDWANRVAEQATGLLEPLAVVEVDSPRGQAMLRSKQPAEKHDELHYYEVLLGQGGDASVRRYRARHGETQRTPLPFALTHEALGKLVDDLVS